MYDPRNWFEKAKWLVNWTSPSGVVVEIQPGMSKVVDDLAEALKVAYELGLQDGLKKVKVDDEY